MQTNLSSNLLGSSSFLYRHNDVRPWSSSIDNYRRWTTDLVLRKAKRHPPRSIVESLVADPTIQQAFENCGFLPSLIDLVELDNLANPREIQSPSSRHASNFSSATHIHRYCTSCSREQALESILQESAETGDATKQFGNAGVHPDSFWNRKVLSYIVAVLCAAAASVYILGKPWFASGHKVKVGWID